MLLSASFVMSNLSSSVSSPANLFYLANLDPQECNLSSMSLRRNTMICNTSKICNTCKMDVSIGIINSGFCDKSHPFVKFSVALLCKLLPYITYSWFYMFTTLYIRYFAFYNFISERFYYFIYCRKIVSFVSSRSSIMYNKSYPHTHLQYFAFLVWNYIWE